jgi:hypothetical protein
MDHLAIEECCPHLSFSLVVEGRNDVDAEGSSGQKKG